MSYAESVILEEAQKLYRRTRRPARTRILADMVGYSERWTRRMLVELETRGVVQRRGQRGGWLPVMVS